MERLIERCCGLDVHKATVSACVRVTQRPSGELKQEVRTFATTTPELLALREWLSEQRVTHVAMEATGVYEGVGNFVFVSHTMKPLGAGGRYGGEQGRRNRG
jgi:hypothetical protein